MEREGTDYAWTDCLTGEWEWHTVRGDHLSMLREPNVADLAADLTQRLASLEL